MSFGPLTAIVAICQTIMFRVEEESQSVRRVGRRIGRYQNEYDCVVLVLIAALNTVHKEWKYLAVCIQGHLYLFEIQKMMAKEMTKSKDDKRQQITCDLRLPVVPTP